jgi:hypothetical protein
MEISTRFLLAKWKLEQWRDWLPRWIAWKLPPSVAMWAAIRLAVHAEPNANPTQVTIEQMLKAWGGDRRAQPQS